MSAWMRGWSIRDIIRTRPEPMGWERSAPRPRSLSTWPERAFSRAWRWRRQGTISLTSPTPLRPMWSPTATASCGSLWAMAWEPSSTRIPRSPISPRPAGDLSSGREWLLRWSLWSTWAERTWNGLTIIGPLWPRTAPGPPITRTRFWSPRESRRSWHAAEKAFAPEAGVFGWCRAGRRRSGAKRRCFCARGRLFGWCQAGRRRSGAKRRCFCSRGGLGRRTWYDRTSGYVQSGAWQGQIVCDRGAGGRLLLFVRRGSEAAPQAEEEADQACTAHWGDGGRDASWQAAGRTEGICGRDQVCIEAV